MGGTGRPRRSIGGILEGDRDEGCVWLVLTDERRVSLTWPQHHSLNTRTGAVLDERNRQVAAIGHKVEFRGGVADDLDAGRCDVGRETFGVTEVFAGLR